MGHEVARAPLPCGRSACRVRDWMTTELRGIQVLVSNLWSVRDFWEWLAPGINANRDVGLAGAAFVSYENLSNYRDFLIQEEVPNPASSVGSPSSLRSAGLWAKQFMTDRDYHYMGTLTNTSMFEAAVTRDPCPSELTSSAQKTRREGAVRKVFERLQKGSCKEQFSPARLADVWTSNALFRSFVLLSSVSDSPFLAESWPHPGHGPLGPPLGALRGFQGRHAS